MKSKQAESREIERRKLRRLYLRMKKMKPARLRETITRARRVLEVWGRM